MIKLIRSNQRIFLAGLTIFAMVSFLATTRTPGSGGNATDHKFATVKGKTILSSEVAESHAEISAVKNSLDLSESELGGLLNRISQPPELFMLLRHEANADGMRADPDDVNTILTMNKRAGLELDPDRDSLARAGVADLLKIVANFKRISSALKVSQPAVNQYLATDGETLDVKFMQIRAQDFVAKTPAPTSQQVEEQFQKFANTAPGNPTPVTNPHGFGYQLPQQSAFEYVRLTDEAVTNAIVESKSAYDWDVLAHKYYYNHLDQLPRANVMGPSPTSVPATEPSVPQSFADAQASILSKLREEPFNSLRDQIRSFILNTTNSDWQAYSKFINENPKSPEPNSSLGVPYSSFSYLVKLYDAVKSKYNVEIGPDKTPDFLSEAQYKKWPGVGSSAVTDFINQRSNAYLTQLDHNDPAAQAQLMQPSTGLEGSTKTSTVYIRVNGVHKAQAPSLSAVQPLVETDVRLDAAYNLAKAQADSLLTSAKSAPLDTVAQSIGAQVVTADSVNAMNAGTTDVKGVLPPLADAASSFVHQTFKLLGSYSPPQVMHPATLIELPQQSRLFIAQLQTVHAIWNSDNYFQAVNSATRSQMGEPAISPAELLV